MRCVCFCVFIFVVHGRSTNVFTESTSFKNKLSDYRVLCCINVFFIFVLLCVYVCVNVEMCASTYGKEAIEIFPFISLGRLQGGQGFAKVTWDLPPELWLSVYVCVFLWVVCVWVFFTLRMSFGLCKELSGGDESMADSGGGLALTEETSMKTVYVYLFVCMCVCDVWH